MELNRNDIQALPEFSDKVDAVCIPLLKAGGPAAQIARDVMAVRDDMVALDQRITTALAVS